MTDPRDFEVGYGRPPKHARFKKGQSGNPKGRPKGTISGSSFLSNEMNKKIVMRDEEGKTYRRTKYQAFYARLINQALKGTPSAIKLLLQELKRLEADQERQSPVIIRSVTRRVVYPTTEKPPDA